MDPSEYAAIQKDTPPFFCPKAPGRGHGTTALEWAAMSAPTSLDPDPRPLRLHRRLRIHRTDGGFLGRLAYQDANALQTHLRDAVLAGTTPEHLLLLEHPHVFTLGRNASLDDLRSSEADLQRDGIAVVETDRGGQMTYHGPGQLVGYPILDLKPDRQDIRRYIRDLQEVLIRTLADFGIEAERRDGKGFVGVWVGDGKIASLGVHLKRWVTTHGFALNVSTDLDYFHHIVACGLPGVPLVSIERLTGTRPSLEQVAERLSGHFANIFERQLEPANLSALGAPAPMHP